MKITKQQLMKIIKEELEDIGDAGMPGMRSFDGAPRANAPCYLVYAGGSSDPFIRYASGDLADVRNFLQWAKMTGANMDEFSVVRKAGDQLVGGNETDITQDELEDVLATK